MNGRKTPEVALSPHLLAGMVKPTGIVILAYVVLNPVLGLIVLGVTMSMTGGLPAGGGALSLVMAAPFILYWIHRFMNLRSREYRFYDAEVETYEGWLNLKNENVSYDMVTDISFDRPVIQRLFGTGTIHLNTAGSNTHEVHIQYVEHPEQVYDRIRDLVWSGQQDASQRTGGSR